jgi:hypothetical protein
MKKLEIGLLLLIILFFILFLFLPGFGKPTKKNDMDNRISNLRCWHNRINDYIKEKNKVPNDLYEIRNYPNLKIPDFRPPPDISVIVKDKETFNNYIEYGFVKYTDGWCVIELKPGLLYKKRIMIDSNRKVYEIREIQ